MRKSRTWPALLVLSLTALGSLSGCKSDEEKQKEAEQSEPNQQMQSLLIEAREIENEFSTNVDKFQAQNFATGLALSDQSKRDEYRDIIEQLKVDVAQYGTDYSEYLDKVHELVKEQDGDDAPDPGIALRFGMMAYVQAVTDLADAHLAVVAHCDKYKPKVGSDGLVEFEKESNGDAYQGLVLALSNAELIVDDTLAGIERIKRAAGTGTGQD